MFKVLSILLVFLATLTNYTPFIPIIFLLTVIIFIKKISFKVSELLIYLSLLVAALVDFMRVATSSFQDIEYNHIIALWFSITFFFLLLTIYKKEYNRDIFNYAVKVALVIHVSFWIIQVFSLYAFSYHIDPILLFKGYEQRIWGPELFGITIYRASGFANEPSGYAIGIAPLIYLYNIYQKKITKLISLSLLTMILTFSPLSWILVFGFLGFVFIQKDNFSVKKLFKTLIILSPLLYLIIEYIMWRFGDGEDASLDVRTRAIDWLFSQNEVRQLFGSGFGINDYGGLIADSTLYFNLFFTYGIFSTIFFFFPLFLTKWDLKKASYIYILFLAKYHFYFIILWFLFAGTKINTIKKEKSSYKE